jgi:hypothetical protein
MNLKIKLEIVKSVIKIVKKQVVLDPPKMTVNKFTLNWSP